MLIAFTQPHMGGYDTDWAKPADGDLQSDYARHAAFYVRMAENHPAVVFYSMNHNAGGYADDMNPDADRREISAAEIGCGGAHAAGPGHREAPGFHPHHLPSCVRQPGSRPGFDAHQQFLHRT